MSNGKLWGLLFLTVLLIAACSKNDDNEPQPEPKTKAPFLVNVMFAPGQLGDKGFADNVMEGVNALDDLDNLWGGDSIEVRFIAPRNLEDAQRWINTSATSYSTEGYERRLLVLTEPYMVDMFNLIKDVLQPTERVHAVGHGDAHGVVAVGDGLRSKAVALRPQNHRQLLLCHQPGMVDADRIVPQRHGRSPEAVLPEPEKALSVLRAFAAGEAAQEVRDKADRGADEKTVS